MEQALKRKERNSRMDDSIEEAKKPTSNPDEIALELMKFIAITTGYGRGSSSTGFGSKGPRSGEEYADSLLELFDRCRSTLRKDPK